MPSIVLTDPMISEISVSNDGKTYMANGYGW